MSNLWCSLALFGTLSCAGASPQRGRAQTPVAAPSSPSSPPVLHLQAKPILAPAPAPIPVSSKALGLATPEAVGESFCQAMKGDPADFIHRFYAPPQLADDHFRCASRIFACGEEAKRAGRSPMSCSAGEHSRRGLHAMSTNLMAGLPEGVELLSCKRAHVERLREPRGFFSKGDACDPSADLRWARIDVLMEMRIDGRPQTKRFRARLVQLGKHGWFNYSH